MSHQGFLMRQRRNRGPVCAAWIDDKASGATVARTLLALPPARVPALNPTLRSIAAAWPYCVYAVMALLLAMIADTGAWAAGTGSATGSATGRVAASDGWQVARGIAIAADAPDHEEAAVAEAAPEAGEDAAAWTGTSAAAAVAHAVLVAPTSGQPVRGAAHARRKLPRGPPSAVA
jgi:hypothetical protein